MQVEIVCVSLSHAGSSLQRQLAYIDRNHDLFLSLARESPAATRIVSLGEKHSKLGHPEIDSETPGHSIYKRDTPK